MTTFPALPQLIAASGGVVLATPIAQSLFRRKNQKDLVLDISALIQSFIGSFTFFSIFGPGLISYTSLALLFGERLFTVCDRQDKYSRYLFHKKHNDEETPEKRSEYYAALKNYQLVSAVNAFIITAGGITALVTQPFSAATLIFTTLRFYTFTQSASVIFQK